MASYIYSERWAWIQQSSAVDPHVQDGQWVGPTIAYNESRLSATGCVKLLSDSGTDSFTPNAFQEADTVLIRRIRLWSPCQGLGLAGAHAADAGAGLDLFPIRGSVTTGAPVALANGLALGEWVDVNETLDSSDIEGSGVWGLAARLSTGMNLDSSRMASAYIGSAFLKFQVQVDLAHTLPAVLTTW